MSHVPGKHVVEIQLEQEYYAFYILATLLHSKQPMALTG